MAGILQGVATAGGFDVFQPPFEAGRDQVAPARGVGPGTPPQASAGEPDTREIHEIVFAGPGGDGQPVRQERDRGVEDLPLLENRAAGILRIVGDDRLTHHLARHHEAVARKHQGRCQLRVEVGRIVLVDLDPLHLYGVARSPYPDLIGELLSGNVCPGELLENRLRGAFEVTRDSLVRSGVAFPVEPAQDFIGHVAAELEDRIVVGSLEIVDHAGHPNLEQRNVVHFFD